ncbi:wd-40 repeat protein [Stylonychia lemnae]|uniref:Wd-40 repeat protein n=1 Tax=Stylonychia lemnae TaxID=5949 RepID=A0A078A752_STYLE|nr:wd-40 repeat protein [Stylonychia lemnae]|eukprot:CDW78074.1 wd-40 repeat protein [Stylonychia lemnae]
MLEEKNLDLQQPLYDKQAERNLQNPDEYYGNQSSNSIVNQRLIEKYDQLLKIPFGSQVTMRDFQLQSLQIYNEKYLLATMEYTGEDCIMLKEIQLLHFDNFQILKRRVLEYQTLRMTQFTSNNQRYFHLFDLDNNEYKVYITEDLLDGKKEFLKIKLNWEEGFILKNMSILDDDHIFFSTPYQTQEEDVQTSLEQIGLMRLNIELNKLDHQCLTVIDLKEYYSDLKQNVDSVQKSEIQVFSSKDMMITYLVGVKNQTLSTLQCKDFLVLYPSSTLEESENQVEDIKLYHQQDTLVLNAKTLEIHKIYHDIILFKQQYQGYGICNRVLHQLDLYQLLENGEIQPINTFKLTEDKIKSEYDYDSNNIQVSKNKIVIFQSNNDNFMATIYNRKNFKLLNEFKIPKEEFYHYPYVLGNTDFTKFCAVFEGGQNSYQIKLTYSYCDFNNNQWYQDSPKSIIKSEIEQISVDNKSNTIAYFDKQNLIICDKISFQQQFVKDELLTQRKNIGQANSSFLRSQVTELSLLEQIDTLGRFKRHFKLGQLLCLLQFQGSDGKITLIIVDLKNPSSQIKIDNGDKPIQQVLLLSQDQQRTQFTIALKQNYSQLNILKININDQKFQIEEVFGNNEPRLLYLSEDPYFGVKNVILLRTTGFYIFDLIKMQERQLQQDHIKTQFNPNFYGAMLVDYQQRIFYAYQRNTTYFYAIDFDTGEYLNIGFKEIPNASIEKLKFISGYLVGHLGDDEFVYFQLQNRKIHKTIRIKYSTARLRRYDQIHIPYKLRWQDITEQRDKQNLFSVLDLIQHVKEAKYIDICEEKGIVFYEDIDSSQPLSFFNPFFTSLDVQIVSEMADKNPKQQIQHIQNNLKSYLKYYPEIGNIFNVVALKDSLLQQMPAMLETIEQDEIPALFLKKSIPYGKSPLQAAIECNQRKNIQTIVELILKYQGDKAFNYLIDENLCSLMKQKIDLTNYFASNMSMYQIQTDNFKPLHPDPTELIASINGIENLQEIESKYDEIFGPLLLDSHDENQEISAIEYFVINLPQTIASNDPKYLMQTLSQSNIDEYFENVTIQTIIMYKWETYAKRYFSNQFFMFLIFLCSYIFEVFYSLKLGKTQKEYIQDERNQWIMISNKILSILILLYFLMHEIKQAQLKDGYLKELWNLFDFSLIFVYVFMNFIEFLTDYQNILIVLQILIVVLSFIKVNFFLRIYDNFSFLVTMISSVFADIKYFFGFFIIFIVQFGLILSILFQDQWIEEYDNISSISYFLMAFRISSGDFNTDGYKDQQSYLVIITWIIWIVAVLVLNVVFMNFIIAVISESYERIMQKQVAEQFRVKVQLIAERELYFKEDDLQNRQYFPHHLILRKPINQAESENGNFAFQLYIGELQGFMKDIKETINNSAKKTKSEIIQTLTSSIATKNSLEEYNSKNQAKLSELEGQIFDIQKTLALILEKVQNNNNQSS